MSVTAGGTMQRRRGGPETLARKRKETPMPKIPALLLNKRSVEKEEDGGGRREVEGGGGGGGEN